MAQGSTQPLTHEYQESSWGVKDGRPAREADNFTAIFEPIFQKMWEPRRIATLWASTACYGDSFIFF
jgi:ABC-type cobalt transport system substrate-binding protein